MANQYVDLAAVVQVIGCVLNKPELLDDTDKYIIKEDDFVDDFHKIVFGSIYNIHLTSTKVTINAIHESKRSRVFDRSWQAG